MNKMFVNCLCFFIPSKNLRHRLRSALWRPKSKFIPVMVLDHLGGDFKQYIFESDMPAVVSKLKKGMSKKSHDVIDSKISDFLNWPNFSYLRNHNIYFCGKQDYLNPDEMVEYRKWHKNKKKLKGKIFLPASFLSKAESFLYHHGLKLVDKKVIDYIEGKDFFDIGAYYGESAIALKDYKFAKRYLFEGLSKLAKKIEFNMITNKIDNFEIVALCLGNEKKKIKIHSLGEMLNVNSVGSDEISMDTLDNFCCDTTNATPGFLKMDIEGSEFDVIKGGINVIKKFRPVMSIAIYHNPIQFFELKPWLEENLDNYIFEINNLSFDTHKESNLLCYPREIIESK